MSNHARILATAIGILIASSIAKEPTLGLDTSASSKTLHDSASFNGSESEATGIKLLPLVKESTVRRPKSHGPASTMFNYDEDDTAVSIAYPPRFTGYLTCTYNKDVHDSLDRFRYVGGKYSSFEMNAAHLSIQGGDSSRAFFLIDLDAGAESLNHNASIQSDGWAFDVHQALMKTPLFATPFTLTAGKFYTSEGIEVQNSGKNPTVTCGFLREQLEPLAHLGAFVTFQPSEELRLSLGAVNGWDNWRMTEIEGVPMAYGKVEWNAGKVFSGVLSGTFGQQPRNRNSMASLDISAVNKSVKNLAIHVQGNYLLKTNAGTGLDGEPVDWVGIGFGLQPVYRMRSAQLGLRYEFLSQDQGNGSPQIINSWSVAPGYHLTPSTLARIEYRLDMASEKLFGTNLQPEETDQVLTAELNYTF